MKRLVIFSKSKKRSMNAVINMPLNILEIMGITEDDREIEVTYDAENNRMVITKAQ